MPLGKRFADRPSAKMPGKFTQHFSGLTGSFRFPSARPNLRLTGSPRDVKNRSHADESNSE